MGAEEPDAHGVEWPHWKDRYGKRSMSLPRSLGHLKRTFSVQRPKNWLHAKNDRRKHKPSRKQKLGPFPTQAKDSRIPALDLNEPFNCWWWCEPPKHDPDPGNMEISTEDPVGCNWIKISELFADERCSQDVSRKYHRQKQRMRDLSSRGSPRAGWRGRAWTNIPIRTSGLPGQGGPLFSLCSFPCRFLGWGCHITTWPIWRGGDLDFAVIKKPKKGYLFYSKYLYPATPISLA